MNNLKRLFEFSIFQSIKFLIFILPRKLCLYLGKFLGFLIYLLDKKHRNIALDNLKTAYGMNLPSSFYKGILRRFNIHFGSAFMEILKFPHLSEKKKRNLFIVKGEENLKEALKLKKGVLLFSAHYGNWEIAPSYLSRIEKTKVIARPLDIDFFEQELHNLRTLLGADVIYKNEAAKKTLQSLRSKEMIAILIDQNVLKSQGIFVNFFGKKASTTPSLAAFHLRTNSPIIPVFCYPAPRSRYHLNILKPLKIKRTGNYHQDILKITQICTNIIEERIRKNPDYWFWVHKRWKTRP
ncbi:MAG: lysophospholipid acyltransferase family protein [Candidatus Aminicenantaceae bacterium]